MGRKQVGSVWEHAAGENCIIITFIICIPYQIVMTK
jgi:hypothetical protein